MNELTEVNDLLTKIGKEKHKEEGKINSNVLIENQGEMVRQLLLKINSFGSSFITNHVVEGGSCLYIQPSDFVSHTEFVELIASMNESYYSYIYTLILNQVQAAKSIPKEEKEAIFEVFSRAFSIQLSAFKKKLIGSKIISIKNQPAEFN
jgi:hypothetical protein